MTSPQSNANDIFWLARYAHNQATPLFEQAKAIDPSIHWAIRLNFDDASSVYKGHHLDITAHWKRDGMFQHALCVRDKAGVDQFVEKLAADVAALSPLVTA